MYPCPVPAVFILVPGYRWVNGYRFEKGRSPFFWKKPVVPVPFYPPPTYLPPYPPTREIQISKIFLPVHIKSIPVPAEKKTKTEKKTKNINKKNKSIKKILAYPYTYLRRARV
jgi:hypothetical protein